MFKKIKKGYILAFLLGAILFSGIGIVIATNIASSDVDYVSNKNLNVETVKDALDDLYQNILENPTACYNGICGELSYRYWNNNFAGSTGANKFDSTHMPATVYLRRSLLELNYSDFADEPVYIRSVLIDGNVVGHEACLWEANNKKEFCITPNYWAGTIGTDDATAGENTKIKLQRDMQNALGLESSDVSCNSTVSVGRCSVGSFRCGAYVDGRSYCRSDITDVFCFADYDGSAGCA